VPSVRRFMSPYPVSVPDTSYRAAIGAVPRCAIVVRPIDNRLARIAAADAVDAETPKTSFAAGKTHGLSLTKRWVAFLVEARARCQVRDGDSTADLGRNIDRCAEREAHVGTLGLPGVAVVLRVAQHGHDRSLPTYSIAGS